MNTEKQTITGRDKNSNWKDLPFDTKESYNQFLANTSHTLSRLMEEAKIPYKVAVCLKAHEDFIQKKTDAFPIDYDQSVVLLTTDVAVADDEAYKQNVGIAITGVENGLIRILDGLIARFRGEDRYYYINKLEGMKMNLMALASEVTGLQFGGKSQNISSFTFAFNPQDWVFSIQATPKSNDGYFDLPEAWQKHVAFMYATSEGAESKDTKFSGVEENIRYRNGFDPFTLNIETGEPYAYSWEAPMVKTVEIARDPKVSEERFSQYEFRGKDVESYGSDLDRLVRAIFYVVDNEMNKNGDAEVFWSRDDEREYLLQPETSVVSLVTSRQNREEVPLDEADSVSRTVTGSLVVGIEHGLVWLVDNLLNDIAINSDKYSGGTAYKLLAIRSGLRGIIHADTNVQVPRYSATANPTAPVGSLFEFTLWESGGDHWEITLTRTIDLHTPASILTEEEKVKLIIALAGSLGVDLTAKPVVRYSDGKAVIITTRSPGHNTLVETIIVTGDRDDTPVPVYARDVRDVTQVNTPIEQEVTYGSGTKSAEQKLIELFGSASEEEKRDIAEKIRKATENVMNKLQDRIREFMLTGVDPGNPTREKIDVILDVPQELITMNGFQGQILVTANEKLEWRDQVMNAALGLGGESGEVVEEIVTAVVALNGANAKILDLLKKFFFHSWSDKYHEAPGSYEEIRERIAKELGDNLFYNAWLARLFGFTLGEVAQAVRLKLVGRHGEGSPNDNDLPESEV